MEFQGGKSVYRIFVTATVTSCFFIFSGCGSKKVTQSSEDPYCAKQNLETVAGSSGSAYVFNPDPMVASGNPSLSPTSRNLDEFRMEVSLSRLGGRGVLEGQYVDVRNGIQCDEGFGAFSAENKFLYTQSHPSFQEAMTYFYADRYRAELDQLGYSDSRRPTRLVAHCMREDNAYYIRWIGPNGDLQEKVCLGDSLSTEGVSYADDASVVIHELQHSITTNHYSLTHDLNQFYYDEAGALNEGVSDFMALLFLSSSVPAQLDKKIFSRWALGTFLRHHSAVRGAHHCPLYDATFPECKNYSNDSKGFSSDLNAVSMTYPDGVGWTFANNFSGPAFVKEAHDKITDREEIHNVGVVLLGALWDAYEGLVSDLSGDSGKARQQMMTLVLEAIRQLPKPTLKKRSPVTFVKFAQNLVDWAPIQGWSPLQQQHLKENLKNRGLYDVPDLQAGWSTIGVGTTKTPGLWVEDHPQKLRSWLLSVGVDPEIVKQTLITGLNHLADPGEVVVLWFDVQNQSLDTAGGLTLTVSKSDSALEILGSSVNLGFLSSQEVQVQYAKINGTAVVTQLQSSKPSFNIATGARYFKTHPDFADTFKSGIWVRIKKDTPVGTVIPLKVKVETSKGLEETLDFELKVGS